MKYEAEILISEQIQGIMEDLGATIDFIKYEYWSNVPIAKFQDFSIVLAYEFIRLQSSCLTKDLSKSKLNKLVKFIKELLESKEKFGNVAVSSINEYIKGEKFEQLEMLINEDTLIKLDKILELENYVFSSQNEWKETDYGFWERKKV